MVGEDVGNANAGDILDADMNIFPTNTLTGGLALAVPAASVAYTVEAYYYIDDHMYQHVQAFAYAALPRSDRFEMCGCNSEEQAF